MTAIPDIIRKIAINETLTFDERRELENWFQETEELRDSITVITSTTSTTDRLIRLILLIGSVLTVNPYSLDIDTNIKGVTDANMFYADASTGYVGIGTGTPAEKLDVVGNVRFSGDIKDENGIVLIDQERYLAIYNHFIGSGTVGYDLGLATSYNGRDWVIKTEPVISHGTSGQWDEITHQFPELLQVDGILYLYYSGKDTSSWNHFKVGLARSFDGGATWTKYASNPVLTNAVAWENTNAFDPVILYDREETDSSKRWKMWYTASSFGQGIGYAYSSDGLTWTKSGVNPVLSLGTAGQWDDTYIQAHAVVRRGTEYVLFYGGNHSSSWKNGIATFTDPEGTYTRSSNNPILGGDGITTTLSAGLTSGTTTATVTDATVFPIGCPIWIGNDGATRFLTRVTKRNSTTSIEIADAAPSTIASGQLVRSVAYNSVDITGVTYDDGYRLLLTVHQPDGATETGVHELTMLGWINDDLIHGYIDYGAGVQMPITVTESGNTSVSRENWSVVDTYDQEENRHKPSMLFDADRDGVVDNSEAVQGHPASDFAQNAFKTISVSGQSDIVADSPTDTLTIAVSGMTATTNATTDTLTFTAANELLMQDGVTAPPVPLETEAQDDWLYQG